MNDAIDIYKSILNNSIKRFPVNFFNDKRNWIEIVKWLIEDKYNLTDNDIKLTFNTNFIRENKLNWLLLINEGSPFKILNEIYPNKFNEWELGRVRHGFWNIKENRIKATKWLVEEKLKITIKDIPQNITSKTFIENGLNGLLAYHNNSPYSVVDEVYSNKFKPWEFKAVRNNFWNNKNNRVDAIRWLIESKLEGKDTADIRYKDFKDNKLKGLLDVYYNNNIERALKEAYPNSVFKDS